MGLLRNDVRLSGFADLYWGRRGGEKANLYHVVSRSFEVLSKIRQCKIIKQLPHIYGVMSALLRLLIPAPQEQEGPYWGIRQEWSAWQESPVPISALLPAVAVWAESPGAPMRPSYSVKVCVHAT